MSHTIFFYIWRPIRHSTNQHTHRQNQPIARCAGGASSGPAVPVAFAIATAAFATVASMTSWMIVVSTDTVARYVRRNYASGIVGRSLMAFLRDKA